MMSTAGDCYFVSFNGCLSTDASIEHLRLSAADVQKDGETVPLHCQNCFFTFDGSLSASFGRAIIPDEMCGFLCVAFRHIGVKSGMLIVTSFHLLQVMVR